jgi:hypothetical protein
LKENDRHNKQQFHIKRNNIGLIGDGNTQINSAFVLLSFDGGAKK